MNVEDAEILFKSKIDWAAIYSENKVYCVEPGCDYSTKIDGDELTNHMITVHKYGSYPCEDEQCAFVGVSQKHLNNHGKMHTMRSDNNFWLKCLKPNCKATFQYQHAFDLHMRVHNNDVQRCQYCPYSYVMPHHYRDHLNRHFRIKDHKCDQCGKTFTSKEILRKHYSMHEGILYCCLICNSYECVAQNSIRYHLKSKHADVLGRNIKWETVKEYVKMK